MRDTIDMAREAGGCEYGNANPDIESTFILKDDQIKAFEALVRADERNKLASWMIAQGYATGHGETIEGLLEELEREVGFKRAELWIKRINEAVLAEREACAKIIDDWPNGRDDVYSIGVAIRAREQA